MDMKELKKKKKSLGLTNERVSELAGVPLSTVQKAFAGATSNPREETLLRIERAIIKYEINKKKAVYELRPGDSSWIAETNILDLYDVYNGTIYDPLNEMPEDVTAPVNAQGDYTLHDYYAMPPDKRAELVDGFMIINEAPTDMHQLIIKEIHRRIDDYIIENEMDCVAIMSPVDVMLTDDNRNMMEPDIAVFCHEAEESDIFKKEYELYEYYEDEDENYTENNIERASSETDVKNMRAKAHRFINAVPDWVIEVVSPSSMDNDLGRKYHKYMMSGVREYWAVDPEREKIIVIAADDDCIRIYSFDKAVPVSVSGGKLRIDFNVITKAVNRQLDIISKLSRTSS